VIVLIGGMRRIILEVSEEELLKVGIEIPPFKKKRRSKPRIVGAKHSASYVPSP
jgi:hypothetical protein